MARRDHCDYPDCGRFEREVGLGRCSEHRGLPLPLERERTHFEAELDAGTYDAIFGELKPLILQASRDANVDSEIGVLRIVLARLLTEETDPFRLASGVSRITSVIVQAQKANKAISGQVADDITGAIATILEEMNA